MSSVTEPDLQTHLYPVPPHSSLIPSSISPDLTAPSLFPSPWLQLRPLPIPSGLSPPWLSGLQSVPSVHPPQSPEGSFYTSKLSLSLPYSLVPQKPETKAQILRLALRPLMAGLNHLSSCASIYSSQ